MATDPLPIPEGPEALSAHWITRALQSTGALRTRVKSFRLEPFAEGVGMFGNLARVQLELEAPDLRSWSSRA